MFSGTPERLQRYEEARMVFARGQDDSRLSDSHKGSRTGSRSNSPQGPEPAGDVASRVRAEIGSPVCIGFLGGTAFQGAQAEELVQEIAKRLEASLGSQAAFITSGMPGVQRVFASHCGDGSRVWNLVGKGEKSSYSVGRDVQAAGNLEQRREIFANLGDIFITVEGGPSVSQEAKLAAANGAQIVPLMRTGGASSGMFSFPPEALKPPGCVGARQWELLDRIDVPVEECAAAVQGIVHVVIQERRAAGKSADRRSSGASLQAIPESPTEPSVTPATELPLPPRGLLGQGREGEYTPASAAQASYILRPLDGPSSPPGAADAQTSPDGSRQARLAGWLSTAAEEVPAREPSMTELLAKHRQLTTRQHDAAPAGSVAELLAARQRLTPTGSAAPSSSEALSPLFNARSGGGSPASPLQGRTPQTPPAAPPTYPREIETPTSPASPLAAGNALYSPNQVQLPADREGDVQLAGGGPPISDARRALMRGPGSLSSENSPLSQLLQEKAEERKLEEKKMPLLPADRQVLTQMFCSKLQDLEKSVEDLQATGTDGAQVKARSELRSSFQKAAESAEQKLAVALPSAIANPLSPSAAMFAVAQAAAAEAKQQPASAPAAAPARTAPRRVSVRVPSEDEEDDEEFDCCSWLHNPAGMMLFVLLAGFAVLSFGVGLIQAPGVDLPWLAPSTLKPAPMPATRSLAPHHEESKPSPAPHHEWPAPTPAPHHEESKPSPAPHHEESKPSPSPAPHHEESKPTPAPHHEESKPTPAPAPAPHHEESKPSPSPHHEEPAPTPAPHKESKPSPSPAPHHEESKPKPKPEPKPTPSLDHLEAESKKAEKAAADSLTRTTAEEEAGESAVESELEKAQSAAAAGDSKASLADRIEAAELQERVVEKAHKERDQIVATLEHREASIKKEEIGEEAKPKESLRLDAGASARASSRAPFDSPWFLGASLVVLCVFGVLGSQAALERRRSSEQAWRADSAAAEPLLGC